MEWLGLFDLVDGGLEGKEGKGKIEGSEGKGRIEKLFRGDKHGEREGEWMGV